MQFSFNLQEQVIIERLENLVIHRGTPDPPERSELITGNLGSQINIFRRAAILAKINRIKCLESLKDPHPPALSATKYGSVKLAIRS
jgi:hypothetical protein